MRWITMVTWLALAPAYADVRARPVALVGAGAGGPGVVCCNEAPLPAQLLGGLFFFEGAYRPLPRVPIYARVMYVRGQWDLEAVGSGAWWQLRTGLEARGCLGAGGACGFVDLDLGYHRVNDLRADDPSDPNHLRTLLIGTRSGLAFATRLGADFGGRFVRFRIAFDVGRAVTGDFDIVAAYGTHHYGHENALELGLAGAY